MFVTSLFLGNFVFINSVGRCVIPCAFLFVKVSNIHVLVEKRILFKKKDVYNFSLTF